jgi:hypothetical protein
MKLFKKILLWVAIVIVAVSLLAQLIPARWEVTRSTVVNAQPESIYPWLVNIENWKEWNAFSTNDPEIVHTYPGETVGVGARDIWKSKKFGDGNAIITAAEPATGVDFELRFDRMKGVSPGSFVFTAVEGGTRVDYTVAGRHTRNPVHRIFGLFMGNFLGKFFEESLANIKRLSEANPVAPVSAGASDAPGAAGAVRVDGPGSIESVTGKADTVRVRNPSLNVEQDPATASPAAP